MSRFWTIANILDFFYILGLATMMFNLPLNRLQFLGLFIGGNMVITLVAALFEGVDDWLLYLLYTIPNYFVMLTWLVGVVDVYFVYGVVTFGFPPVSWFLWMVGFNLFVIVPWLLSMRKNRMNKPDKKDIGVE